MPPGRQHGVYQDVHQHHHQKFPQGQQGAAFPIAIVPLRPSFFITTISGYKPFYELLCPKRIKSYPRENLHKGTRTDSGRKDIPIQDKGNGKKRKKLWKKVLTLEDGYDTIPEHSREGTKKARMTGKPRKRANKKVENLRKKCLTNESVHGKILERSREISKV